MFCKSIINCTSFKAGPSWSLFHSSLTLNMRDERLIVLNSKIKPEMVTEHYGYCSSSSSTVVVLQVYHASVMTYNVRCHVMLFFSLLCQLLLYKVVSNSSIPPRNPESKCAPQPRQLARIFILKSNEISIYPQNK